MSQTLNPNRLTIDAPRGVDALRALLGPITQVTNPSATQWPASPTTRAQVIHATGAAFVATDRGRELFTQFVRAINHCVKPDSDLVHANDIRDFMDGMFTDPAKDYDLYIKEKKAVAAWYSTVRANGIMKKVDEERSTDHAGGNAHGPASIDLVDRQVLRLAVANPMDFAPKKMRVKKVSPVITDDMRKPVIEVIEPKWDLDNDALFPMDL